MNNTKEKAVNRSPILYLCLAALIPAVLNSVLILIRAAITSASGTTVILVLYYACSLLSLFSTMVGIGASLFYLSRGRGGMACRLIWLTEGASLLPLFVAAVRTGLEYPNDLVTALTVEILSAIGTTLEMASIHFLLLFFVWILFFKNREVVCETPRLSPIRNRLAWANLVVIGALFLYQLIAETISAVTFITENWPNIYRNEIGTIVFSFVYIILSHLIGYAIQYGTQFLLHDAKDI